MKRSGYSCQLQLQLLALFNLLFAPLLARCVETVSVSCGARFTCALTDAGTAECWGYNNDGELGNGVTVNDFAPSLVTAVPAGTHITALALGAAHTCALVNGAVLCWGSNTYGQLGNGGTTSTLTATLTAVAVVGLPAGNPVVNITAGAVHTCALLYDGALWCWGFNSNGQLGLGYATTTGCQCVSSPIAAASLPPVVSMSAGSAHTCAVLSTAVLMCWGNNANGQLGIGGTTDQYSPVAVTASVTAVACGNLHTCAIVTGGALCWGDNEAGQVGDGTVTQRNSPVPVSGLSAGVAAIAAGGLHSCALASSGGMLCWGLNSYGQIGLGSNVDQIVKTPQYVSGLPSSVGVTAITLGYQHTCVLTSSAVICWGFNADGEVGNGEVTIEVDAPAIVVSTSPTPSSTPYPSYVKIDPWSTTSGAIGGAYAAAGLGIIIAVFAILWSYCRTQAANAAIKIHLFRVLFGVPPL